MIITFARRIAPCAKNNQDPRAIFIQAGYKGNPRDGKKEKNSLFLRARCFKDYIHVRPSAFPHWWKDTRFNQVNATTRHLCARALVLPLRRPLSTSRAMHTSREYVCTCRWTPWPRWLLWTLLHTLETVPATARNHPGSYRLLLTGTFLADWFPKKNAPSIWELVSRYVSSKTFSVIIERLGATVAISDV